MLNPIPILNRRVSCTITKRVERNLRPTSSVQFHMIAPLALAPTSPTIMTGITPPFVPSASRRSYSQAVNTPLDRVLFKPILPPHLIHSPTTRIQTISTSTIHSSSDSSSTDSTPSATTARFVSGPPLRFPALSLSVARVQLLQDRIDGEISVWRKKRKSNQSNQPVAAATSNGCTTFESELPNSAACKRLLGKYFARAPTQAAFALVDRFARETQLTDTDLEHFWKEQRELAAAADSVAKLVELQVKIRELELEFATSPNPSPSNSPPRMDCGHDTLDLLRERASTLRRIGLESEMSTNWFAPYKSDEQSRARARAAIDEGYGQSAFIDWAIELGLNVVWLAARVAINLLHH